MIIIDYYWNRAKQTTQHSEQCLHQKTLGRAQYCSIDVDGYTQIHVLSQDLVTTLMVVVVVVVVNKMRRHN